MRSQSVIQFHSALESEISPRDGYKALYNAILGVDKGPRLAPILSELERESFDTSRLAFLNGKLPKFV